MLPRCCHILGAGIALFLCLLSPGLCQADEALDAAKARYERGEQSFEAGKFLEAAADFEEAYKLTPRNDLLYDSARAYDKGGDASRAVELYEAYLRTGDNLPETAQVKERLEDLRTKVAFVLIRANHSGARITIDGRDRGTTPMIAPVPLGSGLHRIAVQKGDLSFKIEQEFTNGLSHTVVAELVPPPAVPEVEKHNRRFVAVFGLGGSIDVTASNFPPSQAALAFGFEYRLFERRGISVDASLRIPLEVGQSWTNSGLLPGVRVVLELSQRVPLELVPSLDLGFVALNENISNAPAIASNRKPCADAPAYETGCTLYSLRIHPAVTLVYHFLPDWEARAELFGLNADITGPIPSPRVSFGLSAAWRFY